LLSDIRYSAQACLGVLMQLFKAL